MSEWFPITPEQLRDQVRRGESQLDLPAHRFWELIRVEFVKWTQHPWGDLGNGFWVVGVMGNQVLWYNDIEDGFNWSKYTLAGTIDEYWCHQDELHHAIYRLRRYFNGEPLPEK